MPTRLGKTERIIRRLSREHFHEGLRQDVIREFRRLSAALNEAYRTIDTARQFDRAQEE